MKIIHTDAQYFDEGINQYYNCRLTHNGVTKDYAMVEIDCDKGKVSLYESVDGKPTAVVDLFTAVKVDKLPEIPTIEAVENLSIDKIENLVCPVCLNPHIDYDEWALRPHKTHLCLYCDHEFEGTIKGVSYPTLTHTYLKSVDRKLPHDQVCVKLQDWVKTGEITAI